MKTIIITFLFFIALFLINCCLMAQVTVQNNGIAYTSASGIFFINGSLNNAPGAAFSNDGSVYINQNIVMRYRAR